MLVTGFDPLPRSPNFSVSRTALVVQRVRDLVGTRPIMATVVDVKDKGISVELSPCLIAWLSGREATWSCCPLRRTSMPRMNYA